jgi:hypothetical protein
MRAAHTAARQRNHLHHHHHAPSLITTTPSPQWLIPPHLPFVLSLNSPPATACHRISNNTIRNTTRYSFLNALSATIITVTIITVSPHWLYRSPSVTPHAMYIIASCRRHWHTSHVSSFTPSRRSMNQCVTRLVTTATLLSSVTPSHWATAIALARSKLLPRRHHGAAIEE